MVTYQKYLNHLIFKVIILSLYGTQYIEGQSLSIPYLAPLTLVNTSSTIFGGLKQFKLYSQYIARYSLTKRIDIW